MTYDRLIPVSDEEISGRRAEYAVVENMRAYNISRTFTTASTRLESSNSSYGSRGSRTSSDQEEELYKIGPTSGGVYADTGGSGSAFRGSPIRMFVGGSSSGSSVGSGLLSG